MIELPPFPAPNGASPALLDFGGILRPVLGGPIQKISRLGSRYRVALSYPPLASADEGRIFVSRLIRAKEQGLRVPYPLLDERQKVAGSPVLDGAGQAGSTINVRAIQPHTAIREGWWLSIEDASGQHYLHNVAGGAVADVAGKIAIPIAPRLRRPFVDGCRIHLNRPMIEGLVDGEEWQWRIALDHNLSIEVVIEEAA